MTDPVEAHPVADLFPLMSDAEMADLVEDVRAHGLREPIWLADDGRIIDGRNRYRACIEAGVTPEFRGWDGAGSLVDFVLSLNLHRRHLTAGQKALVGVEVQKHYQTEAEEQQRLAGKEHGRGAELPGPKLMENFPQAKDPLEAATKGEGVLSRDRAGKAVGVSGKSVSTAQKITREAPHLVPHIQSGEMTLNEARTKMNHPDNPPPNRRNRQPLPDAAQKAGWDLRKAVERVERIAADDRYPLYKQQVAAQLNGHLLYAIEACTRLAETINPQEEADDNQ